MRMTATTCASLVFFRFIRSQANSHPRRSNGTDGGSTRQGSKQSFSLSCVGCAHRQHSFSGLRSAAVAHREAKPDTLQLRTQ
ncbi:hypothetical protein B0T14DRAFT_306650 [Immersiella caudata]|uniref:Uncharacterized protein n=1 Tax=Immersiella caudata TaxID=314043 RepID=A0AA40BUM6_9PEZI|nr:hypothetical protein B0T14DRAFT_306650 [Immersiella caudata]